MANPLWHEQKRNRGKFGKGYRCELCDKPAGKGAGEAGYYSDDRCNTLGPGLVLCAKCCDKVSKLDDAEYMKAFEEKPRT